MTARPVAFAYDGVYPEVVGGAERYYWALCRELAQRRPVVYLTLRHWEQRDPEIVRDGVRLVAIGEPGEEYRVALARHLLRHGDDYAVVHCCCFPPLAASAAQVAMVRHRRTPLVIDWHEVLPRSTWRAWLGRGGDARWLAQRAAIRRADGAVTFSAMHAGRLRAEGRKKPIDQLPEFLPEGGPPGDAWRGPREKLVVSVGRLVEEKRVHLVPPALAALREADPEWRAVIFGDGPERARVLEAIRTAGVEDAVTMAGFGAWDEVSSVLRRARALLAPTTREGFGLVVLEASAYGLPSVLVREPDNAAVELIEVGENGVVCGSAEPGALAEGVLSVSDDDAPARARAWFEAAEATYSVVAAADAHEALHARLARG
jgi:glycosyltransferase involved in cell wall biosynthesis